MNSDTNTTALTSSLCWNRVMWLTQPTDDLTLAACKDSYADLAFPPQSLSFSYLLSIPSSSPPTSLFPFFSVMSTAGWRQQQIYVHPSTTLPTPSWATALTLFLTFSPSQCRTRTVICFSSLRCAGDSAGVCVLSLLWALNLCPIWSGRYNWPALMADRKRALSMPSILHLRVVLNRFRRTELTSHRCILSVFKMPCSPVNVCACVLKF